MSSPRTTVFGALAALMALAAPAVAQDHEFTAYLSRTVEPNSGERLGFHLWGANSVEVTEYRLLANDLEAALRPNGLFVDTDQLTARSTTTYTGWQGDVAISNRAGVYIYVARSQGGSGVRSQAQAVVVSDLSLGVKRDDDSSLVMLDYRGSPPSSASLKVYEAAAPDAAATLLRTVSVNRGVGYYYTRSTGSLIYVARRGQHVAIQNGWDRTWTSAQPYQVHVETDRPLYRPGQRFHYKAVVRESFADGGHRTPVGEDVRVFLRDPNGGRISLATLQTNDFGTVNGDYAVAPTAALGNYTLEVEIGAPQPGQNNVYGSATLGVEEYRKPEYKVEITTDDVSYVQGETITAKVKADYYFGAPVPNSQVSYTVKRKTRWRWWNPWIRPMVFEAVATSFWWPHSRDEVVDRGTATTDVNGEATISFQASAADFDADYEISAKVVDASNREVAGSSSVPVTRAAFDLIVVTDRYVYEPGDIVSLRVNTASTDGAPVSTSVELEIDAIQPDGTEERRFTRTVSTDGNGDYSIRLRATNKNHYRFTVRGTDAAGNTISTSRTIWVEDGQSGGRNWNFNAVEIIADKDTYEPGDTATFLIRTPSLSGRGLITLESNSIRNAYLFDIYGGLGVVSMPISATMTPNVFVSVMVPSSDGFRTASKELQVPPTDQLINVEITADKAEYEPGETAAFQVRTTDADGNPVAAEVSLGIVDEALFALREDGTPKLSETFFPQTWNRVHSLGTTGGGWHGGIGFPGGPIMFATARAAPEAADAGGDNATRSYFPDTMKWIADVTTDGQGVAQISQRLADSLTTWRLTARAVTRATEVGQTKTTTLVRKDLIVRLIAPRALVEGDELELVGIVHNLAKPGTAGAFPDASVDLRLDVQGLTVLGSASHTVTVDNGGHESVTFRVRVDEGKEASLELAGRASFENDALRFEVPIAPRGVASPDVMAGSLMQDGTRTFTLDKAAGAIPLASELRISLSPSLAGTMLDSVEYLTGYPYGCIEQTMSKFLPTLMVDETLRVIGRTDPALQAELPKMVKTGVERLHGMQNADGGFGWFGGRGGVSQSHPYVSAYAAYGLALARQQGYDVPSDMMDNVVAYLEGSLDDRNNTDDSGRAYQCFALSVAGVYRTADMNDLANRRDTLDNYARAVLAIALKKSGSSLASDVVGTLTSDVTQASGRAHWEGNPLRYGSWTSNTVETTAYALWALLEVDPNNSLIADSMAWLLSRRRTNGQYTTTKDTAAVVLTFARYVQLTGELNPNLEVKATVNGQVVDSFRFTSQSLGQKAHEITVPASALLNGANTISIERQGQGALYYTAILDQHVRMSPIPAEDNGIAIRREYFVVTERLDQGQLIEDETPLAGPVAIGDTVRVKISMTVSAGADIEHVNLEDRFPSGFEVKQDPRPQYGWDRRWSPMWSAKEVHDDRVVFFATRLYWWHPQQSTRTYEYRYDLRAETAGTFLALPSFAEAVYSPETNGRTDAVEFLVVPN